MYVRQHFEHGTSLQIRQQLADLLGLDSDTLALTRSADAQLIGVSGPQVRQRRAEVLAWPMVQLAFPVGRQLRVWLDRTCPLAQFQTRLQALDAGLDAQPLSPTLQDAALRDLALAEAGVADE